MTEETKETEGNGGATCSPADFCSYFLQQLEGGTTVVPVTPKGDMAYTVFQFGEQRFKISVAAVKRVRKPKGEMSTPEEGSPPEQEPVT